MFSLLIFHPFFQEGQLTQFAPMCRRPWDHAFFCSKRDFHFWIRGAEPPPRETTPMGVAAAAARRDDVRWPLMKQGCERPRLMCGRPEVDAAPIRRQFTRARPPRHPPGVVRRFVRLLRCPQGRLVYGTRGAAARRRGDDSAYRAGLTSAALRSCSSRQRKSAENLYTNRRSSVSGSVAEWLACWTQAQKGPGSNRSRDAVG